MTTRMVINNPPRWLARALAIVTGGAGLTVTDELFQVVDTMQGGQGMGTWTVQTFPGVAGAALSAELTADDNLARMVQIGVNLSTGNPVPIQVAIYGPNNIGSVMIYSETPPAPVSFVAWQRINGTSCGYLFVPAGHRLTISVGAFAGQTPQANVAVFTAPAGLKTW